MTTLNSEISAPTMVALTPMTDRTRTAYEALLYDLRLARSKIGSILEDLECFEPGPEALQRLQDGSYCISDEIEQLATIVHELLSKRIFRSDE